MNVIYLSFICQGELALQAAVCAAWLLILCSYSSQVGPAQMGPICCTRGVGLFVGVGERDNDLSRRRRGGGLAIMGGGSGPEGQAQWLAPAVPRSGVKKFQ